MFNRKSERVDGVEENWKLGNFVGCVIVGYGDVDPSIAHKSIFIVIMSVLYLEGWKIP